ncbi:NAD(P)/FAD-dependent oxidoreductase [Streptomonospora salina]|uniref:NADH dehydrogenase FAD-containing subunit n=1 Tax=Streptomonospora salina TaxID=104205 RepID=A0A841E749_9ACTN|nr:FAD-dependent oxidoreductase [Streptomonospora salina]MBB5998284.1 NADH dehydrogenase FAD-containing subunit [Streptomonospora salina]
MAHHRVVVLGAGFAGLAAAKRAARQLRTTRAQVTLVNATEAFVERTRLHQVAAGQELADIRIPDLLRGTRVETVTARVTGIDPDSRTVYLADRRDGEPANGRLHYDTLVYALGSSWDTHGVPGVAEHAFAVADADRAARLRDRLAARLGGEAPAPRPEPVSRGAGGAPAASGGEPDRLPPAGTAGNGPEHHRIVVAGGGLTGLETAGELAETYPRARVELVSARPVGDWLQPRPRRHLHRSLEKLGVAVREHTAVSAVEDGRLLIEDAAPIGFDTLVWTAGFRVHSLAADAGLAVDGDGRLLVDASVRSVSHPEVVGAGDAAAAETPGGVSRMTCQTGLPMGQGAGDVAAALARGHAPRRVRLRYNAVSISLGRRDGVTQFVRADDTPVRAALTGRSSAALKEAVTRGVVATLRHPGPYLPRRG